MNLLNWSVRLYFLVLGVLMVVLRSTARDRAMKWSRRFDPDARLSAKGGDIVFSTTGVAFAVFGALKLLGIIR